MGYSSNNTVTPIAPAPTEVRVTKVPIKAPNTTGKLQWRGVLAWASSAAASWRGSCLPRTAL
jgi:hypothetical protein